MPQEAVLRKVESNMTVDPLIQSLKGKLVVSVQAYMGCELNLSVHDQTACTTHTCSINHDWVH